MRPLPVRTAAVALLLLSLGCRAGDSRLERLGVGISTDSVMAVMGGAPEAPNRYLVGGQMVEPMLYRRPGAEGAFSTLTRKNLTPVVVVDGVVAGWGWAFWDSVATAHRIEVTPKQ